MQCFTVDTHLPYNNALQILLWMVRAWPSAYRNNKCFNENWRSLLGLIYLRTWRHVLRHWISYRAKSFFFFRIRKINLTRFISKHN